MTLRWYELNSHCASLENLKDQAASSDDADRNRHTDNLINTGHRANCSTGKSEPVWKAEHFLVKFAGSSFWICFPVEVICCWDERLRAARPAPNLRSTVSGAPTWKNSALTLSLPLCLLKVRSFLVTNRQLLVYSNPGARSLYLANKPKFIKSTRPRLLFYANLESRTCFPLPQGEGHYQLKKIILISQCQTKQLRTMHSYVSFFFFLLLPFF